MADWAYPLNVEAVAGVESRGFIFAGALAAKLGCGFVPLRKSGKLPRSRIGTRVDSEYSSETLELHEDAFTPGTRILFHDDVIALGNCSRGSINLLEQLGGEVVGACFLVEIAALGGKRQLADYPLLSLIQYS
jgi:adenine phosphoribosyltransferase